NARANRYGSDARWRASRRRPFGRCRSPSRSTDRSRAGRWRCAPASRSIASSRRAATGACRRRIACRAAASCRAAMPLNGSPGCDRAPFGTVESDHVCDPAETAIAERDVAAFIADLNQAFPALDLTLADVTLVHRGVVPAAVQGNRVAPEAHEQIRDHAAQGI